MMKSEFLNLADTSDITAEDYNKVEIVYNYYPDIGDKIVICHLYKTFGMRIIDDMLPRAKKEMKRWQDFMSL